MVNGGQNSSGNNMVGSSYYMWLNSRAIDLMLAREYEKAIHLLNFGIASLDQHSQRKRMAETGSYISDEDDDHVMEQNDNNGVNNENQGDCSNDASYTTTVAPVPMHLSVSPSPATSPFLLYCKAFLILAVPGTHLEEELDEVLEKEEEGHCTTDCSMHLSRRDCRLMFSVLLYNFGLCHHLVVLSSNGKFEKTLHKSLAAYQMAIAFSYTDDDPSFLLFELSVLNNSCHIHGHFEDHQQLPKCVEQMECILNTIEADRSCDVIPSHELSVFQRNVSFASQTYDSSSSSCSSSCCNSSMELA
mmetsp:Transcript_6975/g.14287  ORF Transcript_6975/g.14287 Transcript_6975/m.14287 type:complete len:302 (-) Transcript_6975:131-1036(-)